MQVAEGKRKGLGNPLKQEMTTDPEFGLKIVLRAEIADYLDGNLGGGNLHIVLEDLNFDKDSIDFCYNRCLEENDVRGAIICEFLLKLKDHEKFLLDIFEV